MFGGLMNDTILSLLSDRDETGKRRMKHTDKPKSRKTKRSSASE